MKVHDEHDDPREAAAEVFDRPQAHGRRRNPRARDGDEKDYHQPNDDPRALADKIRNRSPFHDSGTSIEHDGAITWHDSDSDEEANR